MAIFKSKYHAICWLNEQALPYYKRFTHVEIYCNACIDSMNQLGEFKSIFYTMLEHDALLYQFQLCKPFKLVV